MKHYRINKFSLVKFREGFPVGCGERGRVSGKVVGAVRCNIQILGAFWGGHQVTSREKPEDPRGWGSYLMVSIFLGPGVWDKETCEFSLKGKAL